MKNVNTATRMKSLRKEIEYRRKLLVKLGNQLGLTHRDTIQNSQKLDELINKYIREKK